MNCRRYYNEKENLLHFVMCVICLLSVVGCGQTKADTNDPARRPIRA